MIVTIHRLSGPCTDKTIVTTFPDKDVEIVKDVLAMVNAASNHKEGWSLSLNTDPSIITPVPAKEVSTAPNRTVIRRKL
jgi:hypothetical protein